MRRNIFTVSNKGFTLIELCIVMAILAVLAGSAAYAVAEAAVWRGTLEDPPLLSRKFYALIAVAMLLGLALDFVGFNAVRMLFFRA